MAKDRKYGEVTLETDSQNHPLNGSDEPIFLFRAQDSLLVPLLARYRNLREAAVPDGEPGPVEWYEHLDAHVQRILDWQAANADRVKLPD